MINRMYGVKINNNYHRINSRDWETVFSWDHSRNISRLDKIDGRFNFYKCKKWTGSPGYSINEATDAMKKLLGFR